MRPPAALGSLTLLLLAALAVPAAAHAQAIPDDIPDGPNRSPRDRQRARFEERYHSTLSRLFVASHVATGAAVGGAAGTFAVETRVEGGLYVGRGGAVYASLGVRGPLGALLADDDALTATYATGVGVRLPLDRRLSVAIGASAQRGGASTGAVEVSPQLRLPVGTFWTVPLGLRLTVAGAGGQARAFVGFSVGAEISASRRRLVLK